MKIFFTAEYDEEALKPLYDIGEVVKDGWAIGKAKMTEEEFAEKSKDADIIITSYDDVTKKVIDGASKLKLIAVTRATPVNVDIEAAEVKNIPIIYTPGRNSDTAAEMTIGLMLAIARKIPMAHMALKQGQYTADPEYHKETKEGLKVDMIWDMNPGSPYVVFKETQLKGKTLGIVGYGSIGKRVGRIARAMGMKLLIYDPFCCPIDIEEIGIEKVEDLEDLMKKADFVTCHLKVTPQTRGLISDKMIKLMKPTAYLINSSRGAILDENALVDALREKRIRGAALDVYASEPVARNHPYITELNNVVITPHIAGATDDVLTNHTRQVVDDVKRFVAGKPLLYHYH
ncbi:2-hydroxyacid dehydrogenase [Pseudoramibacter faecis]|uniref:2-hydroxyacid dehydrogenase n=1 Tax=Pseudoramibacter faecis TaxID=3108534 RepID=UPI002E780421|nr:2-hydroxyacid dehydrogenase [Pseudoramibacter sp. HA2172]